MPLRTGIYNYFKNKWAGVPGSFSELKSKHIVSYPELPRNVIQEIKSLRIFDTQFIFNKNDNIQLNEKFNCSNKKIKRLPYYFILYDDRYGSFLIYSDKGTEITAIILLHKFGERLSK